MLITALYLYEYHDALQFICAINGTVPLGGGYDSAGWSFLFQELLEQRIGAELKSMRSSLVLIEKSAIDNLRSENEVRIAQGGMVLRHYLLILSLSLSLSLSLHSIQVLKKQIQNLTNVFKVRNVST